MNGYANSVAPPSNTPFTQTEYLNLLYRDSNGGNWSRGLTTISPRHDGIDSSDNDTNRQVFALVGGNVVTARTGRVLTGVSASQNVGYLNEQPVIASDYNAEVTIYNSTLDRHFTYLHFSSLNVSVGDPISAGQLIGVEGSTGWSTGIHTHLEVRQNGTREDPLTTLGVARSRGLTA